MSCKCILFCSFMNLSRYHWAWIALSAWSAIQGSLNTWTVYRLVIYFVLVSGSAAGPRLPRVAWDSALLCLVLLTLVILYDREGWDECRFTISGNRSGDATISIFIMCEGDDPTIIFVKSYGLKHGKLENRTGFAQVDDNPDQNSINCFHRLCIVVVRTSPIL